MTLARCTLESPLGELVACASEAGVCLLEFHDRRALRTELRFLSEHFGADPEEANHAHLDRLGRELREYFAGERREFSVALDSPGTAFQRRVWAELLRIGAGERASYLEVARRMGKPSATRAVARANGQNRLSIVVPCHRVIGSDGSLTGYGGGLHRKRWLLEHEARMCGCTLLFA
jgi:AraC family transcriptional regulator of adaptative response/methylated-DNA-[protein]-cysteine methyltransferase